MKNVKKVKDKNSKWEKIFFYSLIVILIGGIADLIQLSFALISIHNLPPNGLTYSSEFWNILTNIRLQAIEVTIATGFLLIYYQLRKWDK